MDVSGKWIDRAAQRRALDKLILDLNSSVSETYGRRERSASAPARSAVRRMPLLADELAMVSVKQTQLSSRRQLSKVWDQLRNGQCTYIG